MELELDKKLGQKYSSSSQVIRVLTESWVENNIYCPNCGNGISKYDNNRPVADFFCRICVEDFELKSKKKSIGLKIVDGAYTTMIDRLQSTTNPNFFILNYSLQNFRIINFLIIPKHFFVPEMIEKRKPLSENAIRAGWTGCNVLLQNIPQSGKIYYIKNGIQEPKSKVISEWGKTNFLRKESLGVRGWTLEIMKCIEKINKSNFSLEEIYEHEKELSIRYPNNMHVKDKIRQQLQILRDNGYLRFLGQGNYELK